MAAKKTVKKNNGIKNPEAEVYSWDGEKTQNAVLLSSVFGQEQNESLLNQALRVYQFNKRQGSANTKTRGEVSGGGKKPWKEKGTGRARQGSTRAPHWKGGGVVFGPRPRVFDLELTKKMKKKALLTALSLRAKNKEIKIIKVEKSPIYKTKAVNGVLLKILGRKKGLKNVLFVYSDENKNILRALKNLDYIRLYHVKLLNAYDVLNCKSIIFTQDAIKTYEK